MVLQTGAGKAACFAALARAYWQQRGLQVLVVVHRKELVDQVRPILGAWATGTLLMSAPGDQPYMAKAAELSGLLNTSSSCSAQHSAAQRRTLHRPLCVSPGNFWGWQAAQVLSNAPCASPPAVAPTGLQRSPQLSAPCPAARLPQGRAHLRNWGLDRVGVIMPSGPANPAAPVQVAMVQSFARRREQLAGLRAGLVIVDEAQHTNATSYAKLVSSFPEAHILGVTATPFR